MSNVWLYITLGLSSEDLSKEPKFLQNMKEKHIQDSMGELEVEVYVMGLQLEE